MSWKILNSLTFINLIQNLAKDIDLFRCLQNALNLYITKMVCQNGKSLKKKHFDPDPQNHRSALISHPQNLLNHVNENKGNEKKKNKQTKRTKKIERLWEKRMKCCVWDLDFLDFIGFYTKSGFVSSCFYVLLYGKSACWHYRRFLFTRALLFVPWENFWVSLSRYKWQ